MGIPILGLEETIKKYVGDPKTSGANPQKVVTRSVYPDHEHYKEQIAELTASVSGYKALYEQIKNNAADLRSDIKVLQEKINSLEAENKDLQAQPIEYVKQPIVVQCPYCEHKEEIESVGDEPIVVSKVLAVHLRDSHVPPELIKTEMYPHCGSCFLNFANIDKIRRAQMAKEIEIRNIQATIPSEYLGDEGEFAVVEAFTGNDREMLRIPRKYLREIPVSVEDGLYWVYKDGKKFYRSIILNLKEHYDTGSSPTTPSLPPVVELEKTPLTTQPPSRTTDPTTHSPLSEPSKGVFTKVEEKQIAEAVVNPQDVGTIKSRGKNTIKRYESTTTTRPTTPSTTQKPQSVTKEKVAAKGLTHSKPTRIEKISNYLPKHPKSSNQDIADALDLDKSNTSKTLKKLLDQKQVSLQDNLYSWIGEP